MAHALGQDHGGLDAPVGGLVVVDEQGLVAQETPAGVGDRLAEPGQPLGVEPVAAGPAAEGSVGMPTGGG
jgi:hypothetical protein